MAVVARPSLVLVSRWSPSNVSRVDCFYSLAKERCALAMASVVAWVQVARRAKRRRVLAKVAQRAGPGWGPAAFELLV